MTIEIKSRRLIPSVVLILLGFCAGAGLNLLPNSASFRSTVHGAPNDPNSALKNVAHDGTLAGDGTVSAPLGIANGGVSAPKLSTATPPSLGQILGFNGANLAWQNAPAAGGNAKIVDSLGKEVGPFFPPGVVLHKIGLFLFEIAVSPNGFGGLSPVGGTFEMDHTTTDCSGPRYFVGAETTGDLGFIKNSDNEGSQLIYGNGPPQSLTINSFELAPLPLDPNHAGACFRINADVRQESPVTTFDLSTLGFVPPFHLEF